MEMLYIVTTVKKGMLSAIMQLFCDEVKLSASHSAKHLQPLKGGKIPIEILVRGRDADQNAKHFKRCVDAIKDAGVRYGGCLEQWSC